MRKASTPFTRATGHLVDVVALLKISGNSVARVMPNSVNCSSRRSPEQRRGARAWPGLPFQRRAVGFRRVVGLLAALILAGPGRGTAYAADAGSTSTTTSLGLTVGSAGVPLPNGFVACGEPGHGWVLEALGTKVRPPTDPSTVGSSTKLTLAKSAAECSKASETLTLAVIGKLPQIDRKSLEVDVDQGRVELNGSGLDGAAIWWRSAAETGHDVCIAPTTQGGQQHCSFTVSRSLGADPAKFVLYLLPPGAISATGLFDAAGHPIAPDSLVVVPARIVIDRVWPTEEVADLSSGEALITLPHGEAVAAVDCDRGLCSLESGMVSMRAARDTPQGANVRLQMRPRVLVRQGQALVDRVSHAIDFVYCPLTGISLG
ncbi:MAG TPA: hypothetical protein VIV60_02760, partial [Polyangiaceae bacterium]